MCPNENNIETLMMMKFEKVSYAEITSHVRFTEKEDDAMAPKGSLVCKCCREFSSLGIGKFQALAKFGIPVVSTLDIRENVFGDKQSFKSTLMQQFLEIK